MKFKNTITGDIMEMPPPDILGRSVVIFNGKRVESCIYSDENGGTVTLENGRVFAADEWPKFLVEQLRIGAYRRESA